MASLENKNTKFKKWKTSLKTAVLRKKNKQTPKPLPKHKLPNNPNSYP